ncbi:MAG: GAF domain-containing sensor histidine kinase [Anaerolineae bacterium]|nr:GAF domain-containing sensor histidine kinase [Anaerolineae bacterium]
MTDLTQEISIATLQSRIQQLERLLELNRKLSAMMDFEPLLQSIIEAAAEHTQSQEASILLFDEINKRLEFVAAPWFKSEVMSQISVPLENSIAGQVFSHGEPILVLDAQNDPRHYRLVDEKAGFKTRTILAVPMIFQGKPMGVLSAVNKISDAEFSESDFLVLETLAAQAAITIKNASLLKQVQDAYTELAKVDQMKSDFIAITSHELRTPLGLILGHATFMSEMVPDDLKDQMGVIVRNANRLKDIVEDLAKVNNIQSGQARMRRQEVNINLIIKAIISNFQEQAAAKNISLNAKLPATPVSLEADGEKIGIALNHLVKNAITYVDEGGKVEITAEEMPGHAKVSVKDNGVGIPEKDLGRVFERFFQVEDHMTRRHGGMGLGLSVAKMMVEMHGGEIEVESVVGEGSTFSVRLPIQAPAGESGKRLGLA